MKKHVLFDLDGTLLPMNQKAFIHYYFQSLCQKLSPYGYPKDKLIQAIWASTQAMVNNTGESTNEEVFFQRMQHDFPDIQKDVAIFDDYYQNQFIQAKKGCGFQPLAAQAIQLCQQKGLSIYLATNPIFPKAATYQRIQWAGLNPADFKLITTYETSVHCKPNLAYYQDILQDFQLEISQCVMIGNDVDEDCCVMDLGMDCYLVTDCLENKNQLDISAYPHGNFTQLMDYLKQL